jgi:hypothetical protein
LFPEASFNVQAHFVKQDVDFSLTFLTSERGSSSGSSELTKKKKKNATDAAHVAKAKKRARRLVMMSLDDLHLSSVLVFHSIQTPQFDLLSQPLTT